MQVVVNLSHAWRMGLELGGSPSVYHMRINSGNSWCGVCTRRLPTATGRSQSSSLHVGCEGEAYLVCEALAYAT